MTTLDPSENVTSVLPSGVCVEPVIVNGAASLPAAPVSPLSPFGIVTVLPSENVTTVLPSLSFSVL